MGLFFQEVPTVNPSVKNQRFLPAPFGKGAFGVRRPKPPWPLWGCLGSAEAGGFRRQSLRNFLPIPSSLFTKKPSPFHMGWYFGKAPTVNPSVKNQRFLPAPFGKGAILRPVSLLCRRLGFIPPSGREVAWGAAPRRREPAGAKAIGRPKVVPPQVCQVFASIIRKHPVKLVQGIGNYKQVQTHKQAVSLSPAGSLSHLR